MKTLGKLVVNGAKLAMAGYIGYKLVEGMKVSEIENKLSGINCGGRGTSCADQLAKAVRKAYEETHE